MDRVAEEGCLYILRLWFATLGKGDLLLPGDRAFSSSAFGFTLRSERSSAQSTTMETAPCSVLLLSQVYERVKYRLLRPFRRIHFVYPSSCQPNDENTCGYPRTELCCRKSNSPRLSIGTSRRLGVEHLRPPCKRSVYSYRHSDSPFSAKKSPGSLGKHY